MRKTVLLTLLCYSRISVAQFDESTIYAKAFAMVGDTVFLGSVGLGDDPTHCGSAFGYTTGGYTGDFTISGNSDDGICFKYYFTPQAPGHYPTQFTATFGYSGGGTDRRGCHNRTRHLIADCVALPIDTSLVFPKNYSLVVTPSFIKRRYEDSLTFIYRNYRPDSVMLSNLTFHGDLNHSVNMMYTDGSPIASEKTILPFQARVPLSVLITSNEGPYYFKEEGFFTIQKEIADSVYIDTFYASFEFPAVDTKNQVAIYPEILDFANVEVGDTSYRTTTITYSDVVDSIRLDTILKSDFSLRSTSIDSNKIVLEFQFTPTKPGWQDYHYSVQYYVRFFNGSLRSYSAPQIYLTANGVTSSVPEKNGHAFMVSPNPADNLLILSSLASGEHVIRIYDILGAEIFSKKIVNGEAQIDVSKLQPGVYMLSAGGEMRKVVVE